jgi:uncharacterized cupredoxin-like copper-binding protein
MTETPNQGGSMHFRHFRLFALAAISASIALVWALPAFAHSARAAGTTVTVTAGKPTEFGFTLSTKSVKHGAVTFKVTNSGKIPHDFKLCSKGGTANACSGKSTPVLAPGKSATLSVTIAKAGSYEYLCTEPGHAAGGMKGDIKAT